MIDEFTHQRICEMNAEIADLKRQLRQALAQVEIVDRALGDPGNTSSKVALDAHDAEVRLAEAEEWVAHRPGDGFYDRRVKELRALKRERRGGE